MGMCLANNIRFNQNGQYHHEYILPICCSFSLQNCSSYCWQSEGRLQTTSWACLRYLRKQHLSSSRLTSYCWRTDEGSCWRQVVRKWVKCCCCSFRVIQVCSSTTTKMVCFWLFPTSPYFSNYALDNLFAMNAQITYPICYLYSQLLQPAKYSKGRLATNHPRSPSYSLLQICLKYSATLLGFSRQTYRILLQVVTQYFCYSSWRMRRLPSSSIVPLTMVLCVRLCLSSVRKLLSERMSWRELFMDTPGDTSASCDTNLMISRLSSSSVLSLRKWQVQVMARGGLLVRCSNLSKKLKQAWV